MPTFELNCSVKAENSHPAEAATVTIHVSARELNMDLAIKNVTETAQTITDKLNPCKSTGVWKVHFQPFSTHRQIEFSANSNTLLRLWHHCSTNITVRFDEFAAMETTISEISAINKHVQVGHIEWSLRPATIALLKVKTRAEATRDAIKAARSMCLPSNIQHFYLVALTKSKSPCLYPDSRKNGGLFRCAFDEAESEKKVVSFEPQDIKLEVEVTTRFVADAPRCLANWRTQPKIREWLSRVLQTL